MASSIMHIAVINELTKKYTFKNVDRLKFGAVLPDAGQKQAGHIKTGLWGYNKKAYDFELFRTKFGDLMKEDDLYLGYYLHLVQDACYRHFVYDKHHWNSHTPGNVEKLHNDYSIINSYVAEKYQLCNDVVVPSEFDKEKINEICFYDVKWFMDSLDKYFNEVPEGDIFFFTREMADEYIAEAVEACEKELTALKEGTRLISGYDTAWDNMPYSLLETTQNTRDLGGYRVDGTDTLTKYGRVIRSDVANYPSERDIEYLKDNGITTIIDMRNGEEKERKPHGLAGVEGFEYHDIPIEEGSGVPESVEAVPYSYYKIAHSENLVKVFKTIADAKGSVMFNCSAGKDRSGVTSALLLWLCGVRKADIVFDYMRTKLNIAERFELIHKNFPDLDMNIVIPNENNMYVFFDLLKESHGTAKAFFEAIGIDAATQKKIVAKMVH
ncbi:tyrosine-protein phosphatase [Butyrivibrio proteoclasticus]|uniref:tyrosine-protein phosphatase n=1 Tax=Butyrivibrio proteoclasticus TaxID=43305 RepID=UPI000688068B|nr:tyrosine-protein phosphatase [Butyrivibrio proteoclasticus]